jgi:hypothetical protein
MHVAPATGIAFEQESVSIGVRTRAVPLIDAMPNVSVVLGVGDRDRRGRRRRPRHGPEVDACGVGRGRLVVHRGVEADSPNNAGEAALQCCS